MVERILDMPPGTFGFRVSARLTRADYTEVLVPPLRRAAEAGERVRILYAIGPGLEMEPGAVWEDIKVALDFGIGHREMWERKSLDAGAVLWYKPTCAHERPALHRLQHPRRRLRLSLRALLRLAI